MEAGSGAHFRRWRDPHFKVLPLQKRNQMLPWDLLLRSKKAKNDMALESRSKDHPEKRKRLLHIGFAISYIEDENDHVG